MPYIVGMYIASVPNRNSPPAILLREAFRENGKVKNRTLANLSHWPPARIEALRRALRGDFDQAEPVSPQLGLVYGLLYVLKQLADTLGLTAALSKSTPGKLALFLVLARVAHRGSRLSAVRWAQDQAVEEVLALPRFDEDDLYDALDDLCARQEKIEAALYARYLRQHPTPPRMFLYDVTSSYLEGVKNELGAFGYNRDGKKGKMQIVIGLLSDGEGEPLAVRVMAGNTTDCTTVVDQIKILQERFQVKDVIFVGDRGMVKSKGKQALQDAHLHYITALTDPQIRHLLQQGTLQLGLFHEEVCEVEAEQVRYVLRKNEAEAARQRHRLEDKLAKLAAKLTARNETVKEKPRCQPESGKQKLEAWAAHHKLTGLIQLKLEGRSLTLTRDQAAIDKSLELAGCYVVTSDVTQQELSAQEVHAGYLRLQKVERDFRALKTGLLEVRPIFLRDEKRTRGHVLCCMLALKLTREMERRLRLRFGTTDSDPHALTLPDALAALGRLCLLHYPVEEKTVVTKLPQPTANQQQILEALGVSLPAM
jgi:Transposase DDE domain